MRAMTFAFAAAAMLAFSPPMARAQAPADPARVAAMLAKFECEQLSVRYAHYFDTDDGDKLAGLFGESGRLVLGIADLKGGKAVEIGRAHV